MTTKVLTSLHNFGSNRAYFPLRSQVPIFSTPNHWGQDSPHWEQGAILSYFTNRSIIFALHRVIPGYDTRFPLRVTFEQI